MQSQYKQGPNPARCLTTAGLTPLLNRIVFEQKGIQSYHQWNSVGAVTSKKSWLIICALIVPVLCIAQPSLGTPFPETATEKFLQEEEQRARDFEKVLNSHIEELKRQSEDTLKKYSSLRQSQHRWAWQRKPHILVPVAAPINHPLRF